MPTKDELLTFLKEIEYRISANFGSEETSTYTKKVDHLRKTVDLFFESNPEEMIAKCLRMDEEINLAIDLSDERFRLESAFSKIVQEYNGRSAGNFNAYHLEAEFPAMLRSEVTSVAEVNAIFQRYIQELKDLYRKSILV